MNGIGIAAAADFLDSFYLGKDSMGWLPRNNGSAKPCLQPLAILPKQDPAW